MQQVLALARRIDPYTFNFLSYFPLQTFPAESKVQILESDDEKTQLGKWLYDYVYKTSLDAYRQDLVRSRRTTQADLQTSKTLSSFKPPQAEEKKAREYVEEHKLDYELLRGLREERVLQILTTGYLKPLHRFQDYEGIFVRAVVNLRSMEQNSKTSEALKYAQSFSSSPEKLREYLRDSNSVLKEWESFNLQKSKLERLPSALVSRMMKNLSPKTTAALKATSKTISKAKVIKWKAVVEGNSIEEALEGYNLKQITHLTVESNVRDLEYLRRLNNLKSLVFGHEFNQPIGSELLPNSLESLVFRGDFNQPIGLRVLPVGLKSLTFNGDFNQPIEVGVLPKGLESINLLWEFNQPIGLGVLPKGLKSLSFGHKFNQPLEVGVFPVGLEYLEFQEDFNQPLEVGVFPVGLKILFFIGRFDQPIGRGVLPIGLEYLMIGDKFNQPLEAGVLPAGLEILDLGEDFNQPLDVGVLPIGLKNLEFGINFNQPLEAGVLPAGLEKLILNDYNQPINIETLPKGLKIVGYKFKL